MTDRSRLINLVAASWRLLYRHLAIACLQIVAIAIVCLPILFAGCDPVLTTEEKPGDFEIEMPNSVKSQVGFHELVMIDESGNYTVDNTPMTASEIATYFSTLASERKLSTLLISRDEASPYASVVELIGLASQAGIKNVKFQVN